MRIEELNKTSVTNLSNRELLNLQLRCSQLWDKNFKDNDVDVVGSLNRNRFLKQYKLVLDELKERETLNKSTEDIDRALFKKAMDTVKYGIDVSDFENITLARDCVTVGVEFAKSFRDAKALEIDISRVPTDVEGTIVDAFTRQVDKSVVWKELSDDEDYIPLFDLVLKARDRTEISKPYPNFHAARVKDPGAFARIVVIQTLPNGVMIYGGPLKGKPGGGSQAQSYRFPKSKFTTAEAKKWLGDHDIKTTMFEPAKKKAAKKLLDNTKEEKKFEKDIRIFPIDKADKDEHIVCGIVYEPDTVDAQGDKANETEIRKAAYQFMEEVQKIRVNHQGKPIKARVLESYIAPQDLTIAKQAIKKGTWVMTTRVLDAKVWKSIKDGELTGYSMAGYATAS